jgi:hypothetical protein
MSVLTCGSRRAGPDRAAETAFKDADGLADQRSDRVEIVDRVVVELEPGASTEDQAEKSVWTSTVNDTAVGSPIQPARTISRVAAIPSSNLS